jgi:hemolysin III
VVALPQLLHRLSVAQLVLIGVGGVLYTVGAIFLATRWPDPFPKVFGYHEVWHVLVVAAVVCHFVAIAEVVQGQLA